MNQSILLAGESRRVSGIAGGTIAPGSLIEIYPGTLTPPNSLMRVHSTSGGTGEKMFADIDMLQGRTQLDNYVTGDLVQAFVALPGSLVNAILLSGVDYDINTKLQSNGDGTLTTVSSTNQIYGTNTADIDLSPAGTNQVDALVFVDSTGSGNFVITVEGTTTGLIAYSSTAATLFAHINTALNATFGTSAIVASGASLAAIILTFSGTGYTNRLVGDVFTTPVSGATGFTINGNGTVGVATKAPVTTPGVAAGVNTLWPVRIF